MAGPVDDDTRQQLRPNVLLIEIPRRDGPSLWAQIDEGDANLIDGYRWVPRLECRTWYAYGYRPRIRKTVRMHSVITGWPMVDHIDHDGLNNTRANLRPADHSLNGANRRKGLNSTSSLYKGVTWVAARDRWIVRVHKDGVMHWVGRFRDEVEAARAYDRAAIDLFGEFACVNFPDAS